MDVYFDLKIISDYIDYCLCLLFLFDIKITFEQHWKDIESVINLFSFMSLSMLILLAKQITIVHRSAAKVIETRLPF